MRRRLVAALAVVALLAAACGDDGAPTALEANSIPPATDTTGTAVTGTTPGGGDLTPEIKWGKANNGVQLGTIEVPVDYNDASLGTFTLPLARHLATNKDERIGSLLVNPGGPGAPGLEWGVAAKANFGKDIVDRFDIIGFDPRGTGRSKPAIDCFSDYDHFYDSTDITPDDSTERQQVVDLAEELAGDCATENAKILQHVGTNDTARDLDSIRRALGEDTISYIGFSYGSMLGAVWATMFPTTVRAAVLDGAPDPTAHGVEPAIAQAKGFEQAIENFFADCAKDTKCAFHNGGDPATAFDALMHQIDEHPLPALGGRPDLQLGAALNAVTGALYLESDWPRLAQALDAAQGGDGSKLMELYDEAYFQNGDPTNEDLIEAFNTIFCIDQSTRTTVAEEDAAVPELQAAAPHLALGTTGGYFCTFFPPSDDPLIEVTGAGAPPILVLGTTGDPATPLASSRKMADALQNGVLLVVDSNNHTGYHNNTCAAKTVNRYLIDPTDMPDDGQECT